MSEKSYTLDMVRFFDIEEGKRPEIESFRVRFDDGATYEVWGHLRNQYSTKLRR